MFTKRPFFSSAAIGLALIALAACTPLPPGAPAADPNQSQSAAPPIRFALDWSLNTNHIGLVIAQEQGFFSEAGIDVEILPLAATTPIEQITAGAADFGISEQTGIQISRTQGHQITSVFQVVQRETGIVIFSPEREDITRPADLDGKTFGGFGDPIWAAVARAVITGDGGTGEFTGVVLNSGVYDSLDSGAVDFTLSVVSWENILAEMEGRPYGTFQYEDFGVPPSHTISIVGADDFLAQHPDTSRDFVRAVARGYAFAVADPAAAAEILLAAHPELFAGQEELVHASTQLLAEGYFAADGIAIGAAQPQFWEDYGQFLLEQGMLVDPSGNELSEAPDWGAYYTNEYLSE